MNVSCGLAVALTLGASTAAPAAEVRYTIDPDHTYPSLAAPHIQGISIWRGKLTKTSGKVTLDRVAKTGSVSIVMDAGSVDFGHAQLNEHLRGDQWLDTARFPKILYEANGVKFNGDAPAEIDGTLTLHGVSKPLSLKINSFKCIEHPLFHREVCGADASGQINRADFGMDSGVQLTGSPVVKLEIQVEAIQGDELPAPPPAKKP